MCSLIEENTECLEALVEAELSWRIHKAKDDDATFVYHIDFDGIGYHKVSRRMCLYRNQVFYVG